MAGRILVVDDVPTNRLLLMHLLEKAYYDVELAASGQEALRKAQETHPDLMLIDVMMPGMDGFELCRRLKADPALAEVPVVMITTLDGVDDRRAGIAAGADDFLSKPVQEVALYARLRSLLRMKAMREELRMRGATSRELGVEAPSLRDIVPAPGALILGVSSQKEGERLRRDIEERMDARFRCAAGAREAFDMISSEPPEAVLIDTLHFSGFSPDFCVALRQRAETRASALLALIDAHDARAAAAALDAGVNDYVMAPFDPDELVGRLMTQLRYKAHADHLRDSVRDGLRLAVTDPLTGLRNRRYFDAHIAKLAEQPAPLSMLAFDLDRFKAINDGFGHAAGDAVLKEFGRRLEENTRTVDLVARIGGEEFVVAMPDARLADARAAAERVRQAVERPGFSFENRAIPVTVSVGVASLRLGETPAALLARADAALFIAKSAGRNRVVLEAA